MRSLGQDKDYLIGFQVFYFKKFPTTVDPAARSGTMK
jgi:hypothetical protein